MNINIKTMEFPERQNYPIEGMKLDKIHTRYNELSKMYKIGEQKILEEKYAIEVQMECESYKDYFFAGKIAKSLGLERIVDIGCAYGHQSEVIVQQGLNYLGVNKHVLNFYKPDNAEFLIGHYPLPLPLREKDLGVSFLSLFWNCYLYEEDTLKKQIEAVSKDFNYFLTDVPADKFELVSSAFTCFERFGNLTLFRK